MIVPTAPLNDRFQRLSSRGEISYSEIARYLDWYHAGKPDTQRVSNTLKRQHVRYTTAVQLALVLGLDPHEAGV